MYDHEIFTRCQAPLGDAKSAKKFEMIHLVCKLWVSKVQKTLNSSFLKTSYLSVFGLCRPIIYRPDDLFQFFCRFCISPKIQNLLRQSTLVIRTMLLSPHTSIWILLVTLIWREVYRISILLSMLVLLLPEFAKIASQM